MSNINTVEIWPTHTGIQDVDGDFSELSASEIPGIKAIWTEQKRRLKGSQQLSNFTEKLSREWAIETGVIENLYDIERGVTQTLIERGFQSELLSHGSTNKPKEFVLKLLNDQKEALEGVFDFVKNDRLLSTSYIKELHAALLRSQSETEGVDSSGNSISIPLIKGTWKEQANYPIRNEVKYTYCPPEHVSSEMDKLIEIHLSQIERNIPSEIQAAWLHHRFTQIHPFQDGNGRVARALASLVLIKDGLFPLVVTRDKKPQYIDSLEAADKGDLQPLIDIISQSQITQFRKATEISESVIIEDDVNSALAGLLKAADKIVENQLNSLREVFDLAKILEDDTYNRLNNISLDIENALKKVDANANVFVLKSNNETDHWFRAQIFQNAKRENLGYFVDTNEYRSWLSLNMSWKRKAKFVFAFHGIGKPFNGSLICAPFLEFTDVDEENQTRTSLVPVTEEGFVFFYSEDEDKLLKRFNLWREKAVRIMLNELTSNL
jgi:Fic family protein